MLMWNVSLFSFPPTAEMGGTGRGDEEAREYVPSSDRAINNLWLHKGRPRAGFRRKGKGKKRMNKFMRDESLN